MAVLLTNKYLSVVAGEIKDWMLCSDYCICSLGLIALASMDMIILVGYIVKTLQFVLSLQTFAKQYLVVALLHVSEPFMVKLQKILI